MMAIPMQFGALGSGTRGGARISALWSNGDPSSNFAGQTVDLADDMRHYDFLWVTYMFSASAQNISSVLFLVPDLLTNGYTAALRINAAAQNRTGARTFTTPTATTVTFGAASFNTATDNSYVIPAAIYGIKL